MKLVPLVVAGLCLSSSLIVPMALASEPHPLDASAKKAVQALAAELGAEVKAAMQAGGPVAAIATCNTRSMPLTDQISRAQGVEVSRTALRVRNPDNKADQWQRAVLEQFVTRQAAGEALKGMTFSEVVEQNGQQVYRMMQAIPTGKACLTCHGGTIATAVEQQLKALYPQDQARGFAEGDLRGAFSIRRVL